MYPSMCAKVFVSLVLVALLTVANGCSATRATATYLKNRALDLTDPVPVGAGFGAGGSAHVTNYLQVGALVTARTFLYRARNYMEPISNTYEGGLAPIWYFRDIETADSGHEGRPVLMGRTLLHNSNEAWHPWYGENWFWLPSRDAYAQDYDRHLLDVGFSTYGVIGFDVVVNLIETPFELADFFAGLVLVDLAGDDEVWTGPRLFDTAPPAEAAEITADKEDAPGQ